MIRGGSENRRSGSKNLPTILSRKRKSEDDDPLQPDIQSYFNALPKSSNSENFRSANPPLHINRPSSRVPLGTISLGSEAQCPAPVGDQTTPLKRGDSTSSRRKQSWKKPKMRESWNQFRSFIAEPVKPKVLGSSPFPAFRWGDHQLMWDLMAKRETTSYARSPALVMAEKHAAIQPKMRAILLDWLIEVCEVYRLHRETFYLAVDFLDRYLGSAAPVPKNRLQLIGVTCLFIGAKLEEIYPPKLQEFAYVTDGACTEEEILGMELEILKRLNWALSPMTPNSWMRTYMQVLHGPKSQDSISFSIPAYNGLPFCRVMQLLDLCMLSFGCLDYNYSVLAASALYLMEGEQVALAVTGQTWESLSRCVRWMSAFAFAIRERSPVQIKSFQGVSPEDAHHLQNHVVDLGLLERATNRLAALEKLSLRESPNPTSQSNIMGLDNTPQEQEGDIMFPVQGSVMPVQQQEVMAGLHPALLSPPLDGDIW